jgi:hypothetical protein
VALLMGVTAMAQEADTPSPFHPVEESAGARAVRFTAPPRPSIRVSTSRTHQHQGVLDPAGLRRTSSAVLGTQVELRNGEPVGHIRDFVIGPNGAIEFLVAEFDEWSYLIPYDAARIDTAEQQMRLSLTPADFVHVPAFVGTSSSLKSAEYRERLFDALGQAEERWGLRTAAREHSAAKPVVPAESSVTKDESRPATDEEPVSAIGLPVAAQPAATQTVIRTQAISPPTAETTPNVAQPTISSPVIVTPFTGRSVVRPGAGTNSAVRTPTGVFAPTSPANSRFPSMTAPRSPASSAPSTSTLGNAPRVSGTTVTPPPTQPTTAPPTTTPPANTPPPAGTSTTTSPSGTRFPARIP